MRGISFAFLSDSQLFSLTKITEKKPRTALITEQPGRVSFVDLKHETNPVQIDH
jgi:hypothetical protein